MAQLSDQERVHIVCRFAHLSRRSTQVEKVKNLYCRFNDSARKRFRFGDMRLEGSLHQRLRIR